MKLNTLLLTMCGLAAGLASGNALADSALSQEYPYAALDFSHFSYQNSSQGSTQKTTMPAVRVRIGSVIVPHLALEIQSGAGIGKGTITVTNNTGVATHYKFDLNVFYGAYLRPQISAGPLTLYALGGFGYTDLKFSSPGNSSGQENSGTSYGAGGSIKVQKNLDVSADYMHYVQGLSSVSLGLVYRFD